MLMVRCYLRNLMASSGLLSLAAISSFTRMHQWLYTRKLRHEATHFQVGIFGANTPH